MVKLLKKMGIFLGSILISSLILSLFYYISLLNSSIVTILNMIVMIGITLYLGISNGKESKSKGYLAGLKIGLIEIIILFLLNLIFFQNKISPSLFIYYGLIIIVSVLGGMIGITKVNQQS